MIYVRLVSYRTGLTCQTLNGEGSHCSALFTASAYSMHAGFYYSVGHVQT